VPEPDAPAAKRKRRVGPETYVCDLGYHPGVPMLTPLATTPDCEPHTSHPAAYVAHSEWAEVMMETHIQRACKGCGLWLIWEPKEGQ
jgi:hypothetical protein